MTNRLNSLFPIPNIPIDCGHRIHGVNPHAVRFHLKTDGQVDVMNVSDSVSKYFELL